MSVRWTRVLAAMLLTAGVLATNAAPASAALAFLGYANFDGLAAGGVCADQSTPYTVSGWNIVSSTLLVEFCPGNLNAPPGPPDASHLEAQPGTTTLQQDLPTNPIYNYVVSYTVDTTGGDTITTQVTAGGTTTPCVADTSAGPFTCDVWFFPVTGPTTSFTVSITNGLATNIQLDDLYVWVPA